LTSQNNYDIIKMESNQLNKMAHKKRFRKFEKNFSKQTTEEINDIIRDEVMATIWDNKKYCSMEWTITVNMQTWEDLEKGG